MLGTVIASLNEGFLVTLALFGVTLVGALPLGLIISFGSMSKFPPLKGFCRCWCGSSVARRCSAAHIIFYVPGKLGHNIWGFEWPVLGGGRGVYHQLRLLFLGDLPRRHRVHSPGTDRGRIGAGHDQEQIFFKVKLMQLIRRIVPPMSNEIITLVKDTSLANTIALTKSSGRATGL